MQYRQTPPIQWLPIFEVAASELSFKQAAHILCVTPPAVSQQIKALEAWLGVTLFERRARKLKLTREGEFYLGVAREVLRAHTEGYQSFRRHFDESTFRISTSIFIAQELLLPHYLSFSDFYPGTELRIEAGTSLVEFDTDSVDATIRFGTGEWPNIVARKLCDISLAPVCSPDYQVKNPIQKLADLSRHKLIMTSSMLEDWGRWGLEDAVQNQNKIVCDSYMAAMKAASAGLGVAMGLFPITNTWIDTGALISPIPREISTPYAYWVCSPQSHPHAATGAFFEWSKSLFDQIPNVGQAR